MRKFILLIIIILISISYNYSRGKLQGYAVKGGKIVNTSPSTRFNLQESYPNCTVTVYLQGTLTLATIYSDNASTPKSNPFTADATGFFFFYADNGRYDVKFSGTGITSPFTVGDQMIYDASSDIASTSSLGRIKLDKTPTDPNNPTAVEITSDKVVNKLNCKNPENSVYGANLTDSVDDSAALQSAITAAILDGSHGVCINAGRLTLASPIIVPSYINIFGLGGSYSGGGTEIYLTGTNTHAFEIGEGIIDVSISNMTIKAASQTNTYGIYFEGAYPNSSQNFKFSHLAIIDFDKGVWIRATDVGKEWQASYITIEHSIFINNNEAIRQEALNSEITLNDVKIYGFAGDYGFRIFNGGNDRIINSYGLGNVVTPVCTSFGAAPAYEPVHNVNLMNSFISIEGQHGQIVIENSPAEYIRWYLRNTFEDLSNPISIKGVAIPDISLEADTLLIVEGSTMYVNSIRTSNSATNDSRIISIGNNLFSNGFNSCFSPGTGNGIVHLNPNAYTIFKTEQAGANFGVPIGIGWMNSIANSSYITLTEPMLSVGASSTTSTKNLFRLGIFDATTKNLTYGLEINRNGTNGFWDFTNVTPVSSAYNGFRLDGWIQNKTDFSLGGVFSSTNSGLIGYDTTTNIWKIVDNTSTVYNIARIGVAGVTANRLMRASGTSGLFTNSLLSDDGTNISQVSGNFTLTNGNLGITAGNATLTNGNFVVTAGNATLTSGNLNMTAGNIAMLNGRFYNSSLITFTDLDTTPTVANSNLFKTANTANTHITMFDNGIAGQKIVVICNDVNTTIDDGGNLKLNADLTCAVDTTIELIFDGTNWYELSRSAN